MKARASDVANQRQVTCASANTLADTSRRPRSSLLLVEVLGHTTRCYVFKPVQTQPPCQGRNGIGTPAEQNSTAAQDTSGGHATGPEQASHDAGVLLMSDIFGCDTVDNLRMCQRLANALDCPVYMPDLFREAPWPEQTPVSSDTWPTEVAAAVAACMAAAGAPRIALIGFCYGGGRVVDALGNTRTDLLESCAAPPATYSDVFASDASIDDDLLDAPPLPPRPTYTCGVAFYGTRIDLAALARVRQPLLLAFAGDDGLVPPDFIEDMRRTRARRPSGGGSRRGAPDSASADVVQIRVETGAPHGFVHQADKQGEAGDRVLAQAVLFLRKHLLHDRSVFI